LCFDARFIENRPDLADFVARKLIKDVLGKTDIPAIYGKAEKLPDRRAIKI
jgi:hypothetical protein